MQVGTMVVRIPLPGARSLKDKRSVVKSVVAKTRARFNVSMAEVESMDVHRTAILGVAAVSNSRPLVEETLDAVLRYIEDQVGVDVDLLER